MTEYEEVFSAVTLIRDFAVELNTEEAKMNTVFIEEEEEAEELTGYDDEDHNDEEEEEEFSFVCLNPDGSPISADDCFDNGQIRPIYPIFNRDILISDPYESAPPSGPSLRLPLRKLFVEERSPLPSSSSSVSESVGTGESVQPGTYCEWPAGKAVEDLSPELAKKSNSTGFSKRWRFRDFVMRSNSEGKDALVFVRKPSPATSSKLPRSVESAGERDRRRSSGGKLTDKEVRGETTSPSAHQRHYVSSKAKKEEEKRKSYLPYRQEIFHGIFTNVNGLTRNIHPY